MKRERIKYLIVFAFIAGFIIFVFLVQPSRGFLFQNAKGDCSGRCGFMYNALYKDTSSAEVVLFGSSRTMNDINDSLMTSVSHHRFLNLGYCRFGRNMDYFFIEEYCNTHHPLQVVLEVREEEGNNVHPLTPFLMPVSKVAENIYTFRFEVIKNLYDKWLCNLKFVRGKLFGNLQAEPGTVQTHHGFWYGNKITDIRPLIEKRHEDSVTVKKSKPEGKKLNSNSEYYFKKLKALCVDKKIQLNFLYLPSYGNIYVKPLQEKDYVHYGNLLIPPDSILKNVQNYSDYGHLNKRGADRISTWLMNIMSR